MLTCILKVHDKNLNIKKTKVQHAFNNALIFIQELIISFYNIFNMCHVNTTHLHGCSKLTFFEKI